MEEQTDKKGLPFKDFLDKTTNLITVFGIFNALFIYATTIEDSGAAEFLLPTFFLLSILVWIELVLFTVKSNDGSAKYYLFYILISTIGVGLIWFFVKKFAGLIALLIFIGIFFLFIFLFTKIITWTFIKFLAKRKEKNRDNYIYGIIMVSIILAGLTIKLSSPLIKPAINKIIPETSRAKTDSTGKK